MEKDAPKIVRIHDIKIDKEYAQWLCDVKARYRNAQIKAAVKINSELLRFDWQLGRDLVERKAEEKWGAGIVEQISLDLQAAFPESKGFSISNLWRMKRWYSFYAGHHKKLAQLAPEIQHANNQLFAKTNRRGADANDFPTIFTMVPWGHHIEILNKCKTIEEALFYVTHSASEGWSRSTLINCISADYFHTSGGAITNFEENLPSPQSELAQAITKDTYDFGFISLKKGYEENDLETELEKHLTRFLLELGTGFAYLGRQKQIIIAGKTRKMDMLFFHIQLNCYVVIELKTVAFKPEFAGKLNFYVNAVDDLIKTPSQNPTIGLLICSNKDETEVRYAIKGVQTPLGVASYNNVHVKMIQDQLPSVDELKRRIRLLEEEVAIASDRASLGQ